MLRKVDRILIRVESLEAAVRYYRDVVGLRLVKQDPRLASFRLGDGESELVLHNDADLPDQASDDAKVFLKQTFEIEHEKRPTAEQLLESGFCASKA